jgi:hypothetical protein
MSNDNTAATTGATHGKGINPDTIVEGEGGDDQVVEEDEPIVLTLLKLHPEAAHLQDDASRLPLHCLHENREQKPIDQVVLHSLL